MAAPVMTVGAAPAPVTVAAPMAKDSDFLFRGTVDGGYIWIHLDSFLKKGFEVLLSMVKMSAR